MHTILYTRVSTDQQGLSLTSQDERLRAYLALKGLETHPDLVLADEAQSGRTPLFERRNGRRAWAILNEGWTHPETGQLIPVKHLCIAKVDRLARNTRHALELYEWFEQAGCTLHIADCMGESFSTQGVLGKMFFTFQAMFAEYEVEVIRDRIRQVLGDKFQRGEAIGPTPYGWDDLPTGEVRHRHGVPVPVKRRVPNALELGVILQVLAWRGDRLPPEMAAGVREKLAAGITPAGGEGFQSPGWGAERIAKRLNALGYATKNGATETGHGLWTENAINRIMAGKHVRVWVTGK